MYIRTDKETLITLDRDVRVCKKKAKNLSYFHLTSDNIFEHVKKYNAGKKSNVPVICKRPSEVITVRSDDYVS